MTKKGPQPKPIGVRFWAKVERRGESECWPWKAGLSKGCGHFGEGNKTWTTAPRLAFELWWGVVLPRRLDVCHDCPGGDNPLCCNPAHLFISDRKGHMADRAKKGQVARGCRSGSYTHPEKRPRGAQHG